MRTIAIIFGGKSFEHEISIVSAITMKKILSKNLEYIFMDANRNLYQIPSAKMTTKYFSSGEYKKCKKINLLHGGLYKTNLFGAKKINIDFVLNLVHGGDGEDGILASVFDFFNIPFIGPRVNASVVSFDKYITKSYSQSCKVKTLPCQIIAKGESAVVDNYPVIVKPSRLGSSIGLSIAKNQLELEYALDVAFEYDNILIIEPFIKDVKEYNIAGARINGEIVYSIIEEPQKDQFLSFDKKYLDFNRTSAVSHANINNELTLKIKKGFEKLYNDNFNGSLIRCDFFVVKNEIYLNEINSIPGSMANYLFEDFNKIIDGLCNSLPSPKHISIDYAYVNKIQSSKGK